MVFFPEKSRKNLDQVATWPSTWAILLSATAVVFDTTFDGNRHIAWHYLEAMQRRVFSRLAFSKEIYRIPYVNPQIYDIYKLSFWGDVT